MSLEVLSRFTVLDDEVLFHDDSCEDQDRAIGQAVFDEKVWENMKARKIYRFLIDSGCYNTQDVNSNFTMLKYIMAHPEGMSLAEILGEGVGVVTQRAVLFNALQKELGSNRDVEVDISCELFDGVIFAKRKNKIMDPEQIHHYRSVRVKRFNGPDLPGCIGKVPEKTFETFPDIGTMYSVILMSGGDDKKVLYNSQFSRYSPEGDAVELRAIDNAEWVTKGYHKKKRQFVKSALQARLACLDHFILMHYDNKKQSVKPNFFDFNAFLDSDPSGAATLNIKNMFAQVEPFLAENGHCDASLQLCEDGWQYVPRLVDEDFKPFLSQAFRDRFAPEKPKDINEDVEQKQQQ